MKRLIIDTDPGIDDAQAITMALKSDDLVEVVAFTTCHGNVDVGQASVNLQRILKANKRTDIPIYSGTTCSLLGGRISSTHYHGIDGLGDVPDSDPPEGEIQAEHGVHALLRIVNENIAKGNITASAEFNFLADPEAARVVLRELRCPKTTLVTWELCTKFSFSWEWYEQFINTDSSLGCFFKKLETKTLATYFCDAEYSQAYVTCDQLAMAIVIDPEVVSSGQTLYCDVELTGDLTRGQVVVDWKGSTKKSPNVFLVKGINFERYKELFMLVVKETQENGLERYHQWQQRPPNSTQNEYIDV